MKIEPQKQHAWLTALVGAWSHETEVSMDPGAPPRRFRGAETVRTIGGLWIVCEARTEQGCDGEPGHTLITLGYDPRTARFVGTCVASMMAEMWVYDGALDETGTRLSLHTSGPSMKCDGSTARYVDIIEIVSERERVLRSRTEGEGGAWIEFMTGTYRRTD